jgi:uncharacterized membrane protein YgcG
MKSIARKLFVLGFLVTCLCLLSSNPGVRKVYAADCPLTSPGGCPFSGESIHTNPDGTTCVTVTYNGTKPDGTVCMGVCQSGNCGGGGGGGGGFGGDGCDDFWSFLDPSCTDIGGLLN